MKKIYFLILFFPLISFSCSDDDSIDNPEWVESWISEIEDKEFCTNCEIHRYTFEGDFYYELYSPMFSCMPCQVHDSNGADVDWTDFNPSDYLNKRKHKRIIYRKSST